MEMDQESLETHYPPIIEEEEEAGSERDDLESQLEGNGTQFTNPQDEAFPEHSHAMEEQTPRDHLQINMGNTDSEDNESQQEEEEEELRAMTPQGNREGTPQIERGHTNPGFGG